MDEKLIYEEETYAIRGAIFEVYRILGDGYLEEVYQIARMTVWYQPLSVPANAASVFSVVEIGLKIVKFHGV